MYKYGLLLSFLTTADHMKTHSLVWKMSFSVSDSVCSSLQMVLRLDITQLCNITVNRDTT